MADTKNDSVAGGVSRLPYSVDLLGSLQANLEGLQGYGVMALELVQNADDARAEAIVFDVTDEALLVRNNAAFSNCGYVDTPLCAWKDAREEADGATCDFHRITRVASGGKRRDPENIGRFGIGFISVYQITDRPQIASSGVRLTLIPEEETSEVRIEESTEGTVFTLPWARHANSVVRRELGASAVTDSDLDDLRQEFIEILGRSLHFLKHVTKAEVRRNGDSTWVCQVDRKSDSGLVKVETSPDGRSEEWLLLRADAEHRADPLRELYPRLEEARRSTAVSLAIPLTPKDDFSGLFYAYLPTEQATGLPIHINADFYPEPDRRSITLSGRKHQQAWNEALIAAAADRLAEEVPTLPKFLTPEQLWALLEAATHLHDRAEKEQVPACMAAFWTALEEVLASNPSICWSSQEKWVPCDGIFLSRTQYQPLQVEALRTVGIDLTHHRLRPYQNVLLKAGVPSLTLAALAKSLSESVVLAALADESQVSGETVHKLLHPLWGVVEDLLSGAPGDRTSRSLLVRQPMALSNTKDLRAPGELCRVPPWIDRKTVRSVIPTLRVAAEAFCQYPALAELAEPMSLRSLVAHLEARVKSAQDAECELGSDRGRLKNFYRLCTDLASSAEAEDLKRLAELPIFRGGEGFVSAANAVLPGDFSDPLGVTNILDRDYFDPVALDFLSSNLKVPKQSLEHFIRNQLPGFFQSGPTPERYGRLLTELARHSDLVEDEDLMGVLRGLPMIPTRDGEWDRPEDVYYHTEALEALLGDDPIWWLDESRVPTAKAVSSFLTHLGVRREPAARHLVYRLARLAEDEPTQGPQKASETVFYAICDRFDQWQEEEGEDLEALEELQNQAVLPAIAVEDEWFTPSELYAPYRMEAFESQVPVLAFRNTHRLDPETLQFLGFTMEPETTVVVAHLRQCVSQGKPVSVLVYQVLSERVEQEADRELLASLSDEPCIYDPDGQRYLRPGQLFWTTPHLGEHAFRVPQKLESYRRFLEAIGVKDEPSAEDCLGVLDEIAQRFGDTGEAVPADETAVVRVCLSTIASSVEQEPEEGSDLVAAMQDIPCLLNIRDELCYADEVVIHDSDWHAEPFGEELEQRLVEPNPDIQVLYERLCISPLSKVAIPVVEYREGERAEPDLQSRLRERADLILRLMQDQPSKVRKPLRTALTGLEVTACRALRVQFWLETGDVRIASAPQRGRAVYELGHGILFVAEPVDNSVWAEIFKSIFHLLVPAVGAQELASRVYNAKQVMRAASREEAAHDLSEAGFRDMELDPGEDSVEGEALSAELAGMGSATLDGDQEDEGRESENATEETSGAVDDDEFGAYESDEVEPDKPRRESRQGDTAEAVDNAPLHSDQLAQSSRRGGEEPIRHGGSGGHAGRGGEASNRQRRAARRKDRLRSYVTPNRGSGEADGGERQGDNAHEYAVEDAARDVVCCYERKRGPIPEEMSRTHPGFDIQSLDRDGNIARLIEVKGIDGEWSKLGAGLRRTQFLQAQEEGELFWLYVVEFARDPTHATVHAIQNPAFKVDEFFFDTNWRALAEPHDADIREGFRPGARIRHGLMGNGRIEEVMDRGASKQMVVDFDHGGRRLVALNLAQMELLSDDENDANGSNVP